MRQALDGRFVDCMLAGTISTQRLIQEHRQGLGRGKQSFPVCRQKGLYLIQPLRRSQCIEKGIAVTAGHALTNTNALLFAGSLARLH